MAPPIPRADDISQSTFLDSKERDFMKWMKTPEATKISEAAKDNAWKPFLAKYPNADRTKFVAQVEFAYNHTATADIYFKAGQGHLINVFGSDSKYWSPEMKKALGVNQISGGFPQQLSPSGAKGSSLPIPAVGFHEAAPSLKKIFNSKINIYVTPDQYFTTKLREIFQKTKLKHTSGKESKKWLAGPNMAYWPQQLNFAVWCATTGCGISRDIFDEEHSALSLPPIVRNFYLFHVYFTIRRILFQMGGIQSVSALPGDPTFSQFDNKYDVASYKRICAEFGVDPSSDFRFTTGANHGLGAIYIWISSNGIQKTGAKYPDYDKFSDEGGTASDGNLIYYIQPDDSAASQADWFCANATQGLTQAGLSRVNQSIEAFVYCILGSQVNVRSSILGTGGRAKEAQSEFLVLVEDAIRQPDLAKSVQRYQLAIDEAKVRLNLAVCPGAWLMPARMVINTESVVGYNNQLKQAVVGMKLGVNDEVNKATKKAALKLMAGGKSKINPPNSHPSNPIHKSATAKKNQAPAASAAETPASNAQSAKATKAVANDSHEINKATVAVGAVGAAALLYTLMR
ncbi:uncharacterized protein LOC144645753 [Oculina patagonica]